MVQTPYRLSTHIHKVKVNKSLNVDYGIHYLHRAGETVQWLRMRSALLVQFPEPTQWWVTTACNSTSRDLTLLALSI